jgi:plastocyanin
VKRLFAGSFGAILITSVLVAPAFGGAGPTYNVQTGAFYGDLPASGNNFYPEQLSIHPADQINFVVNGFHTATLLPVNEDPDTWLAANAAGPEAPYEFFQADPDDGANAFKYNVSNLFFPSSFDCGSADAPCDYDGSSLVNSGVALGDSLEFTTRLDVPAGSTVWAICFLHPAAMRMEIDVVDEATPVQTQEEIDSAYSAAVAQEASDAAALHEQLLDQHSSHMEGNRKVWDMYAGYDTEDFALFGFYPAEQRVRRGQGVEWHFGSLVTEDHTVSIDRKRAKKKIISKDFQLACDPDGDDGPGPDGPPELEQPPFCNDPTQFEIDAATRLLTGAGDGKYTGGRDLESASARGANIPGEEEAYQVNFTKDLDKTIPYICAIHPFMIGKIKM